jgi:HAD superfamily hydrolase (TIGR01662 family)
MSKLVILDKDGTLIATVERNGKRQPANRPDEQVALPGVAEKLAKLRAEGYQLAIASNQGGVAWGIISPEQADELVADAAAKVGGVDAWAVSYCDPRAAVKHPDSPFARDCANRKPRPGMLFDLMKRLRADPKKTMLVGDMDSDAEAAKAAGISFSWAKDFFGWTG